MGSNNALALSPAGETKWTIINGPMKGSVRVLALPSFTVGRSSECEFPVGNDPNCSRRHATVQWSPEGFEVVSLNEANLVLINGSPVTRQRLSDNDVVTFGSTEVLFNLSNLPVASGGGTPSLQMIRSAPPGLASVPAYPPSPYQAGGYQSSSASRGYRSSAPAPAASNKNKMIIFAVVGAIVIWFFTSEGKKKKEAVKLRTEQAIQEEIETANKLKDAADSMRTKKVDVSLTGRQAQENYIRGFRDYRKGQYERALESFQACLALNPGHTLCALYTRLANRKFSELVQYHIVLGRKYRDQNQFQACRSSFRNVMIMVKDANAASYKEAKANYEACNSLAEGRY